jgi:hypothetical protein
LSTCTLSDITSSLQQTITQACEQNREAGESSRKITVSINLDKGDYAIQAIEIPRDSSVTLFSKDKVRLLYVGKRNRPMFIVGENSSLFLKEKLEIFYNTNNVQEVIHLMIRKVSSNSGSVDISKGVKFSLFSKKT